MEEIKVGEYVKTKLGYIGKVIDIYEGHCFAKYHIEFQNKLKRKRQYLSVKTILKHSSNIIDLIEVGDIVNGSKVIDIAQTEIRAVYTEDMTQKLSLIPRTNKDIKSIVTKEQFKTIEYKVE